MTLCRAFSFAQLPCPSFVHAFQKGLSGLGYGDNCMYNMFSAKQEVLLALNDGWLGIGWCGL